jgi:hypothetical protein
VGKRRPSPVRGKVRTRDHVIADLAVNHVERQVLLAGCTVQEIASDYGVDLVVFVFSASGEPENGALFLQVKATERGARLRR